MRAFVTTATPNIVIALSRRNLLTLLAKLDQPDSARTLISRDFIVDQAPTTEGLLVLVAEDDAAHYRDRPAGALTQKTELAIARKTVEQGFADRMSRLWAASDRQVEARAPLRTRRQHAPGQLHPWVFRQHQVWVDRHGIEYEIESMPQDYVANVISFCEENAWRMWWAVTHENLIDEFADITRLSNIQPQEAERRLSTALDELQREAGSDPREWLHTTPLYAALERRAGRRA